MVHSVLLILYISRSRNVFSTKIETGNLNKLVVLEYYEDA